MKMNITIVSSSTREGRISPRIAIALERSITAKGHKATILDLAELNLPPFDERLSHLENPTDGMKNAHALLSSSDGFIFLTPEYNGAISSGLKNFIDVFAKDPFNHKPIGVATGSTGDMGGIRAAYQLQQSILSIYAYPIPEMLMVSHMDKMLDENGNVTDDHFQPKLDKFVAAYVGFAEKVVR